jgi:hypothetical protein
VEYFSQIDFVATGADFEPKEHVHEGDVEF